MEFLDDRAFACRQKEEIARIEEILRQSLPKNPSYQKTIFDAAEYSLMAGGKRLRPMMMRCTYQMFGGSDEKRIDAFAAAIEMIHTYSLVHDDLPCIDNDDYRRGKKTTHKVFGEDMGLLTGDALLNFAYETALFAVAHADKNTQGFAANALWILAKKAGVYGMVGGQVVDVQMTGKTLDQKRLNFIYELKTAALLEAALMAGAALAGADDTSLALLESVGKNVGLAFQIQDDILDVTGNTKQLGKTAHSDEKNNKTTYVTLYGLEKAKQAVRDYSAAALDDLEKLPAKSPYLNTLIQKLINREK